ncbi:hypothetical protein I4U23_011433 [Adineta vaga]|nr:hypothetical protein I4U23_011433 [Adineta vaga]
MHLTLYILICFVITILIDAKPSSQVEESSLRIFFRHIDLNGNDELDVYELQNFFHDIEPEDDVPDRNHIIRTMKRTMKPITNKQDEHFQSNAPQQIHLSLLADGTWSTMIVIWIVKGSETKRLPPSFVQYGTISRNYTSMQLATNRTYDVGIGGWKGTIYEAWMTNLEQCQVYYYRVGNAKAWSDEYSFKTDCANRSTRIFAVMGDMGTIIPAGHLVAKQITEDHQNTPFTCVVHVGDISYAGTGSTEEIAEIWDMWGRQVEPISSIVPYMTNVGNHEAYYNYTAYRNRFRMPGPESGGLNNFWFSFNTGPVHWISMSSQHDYSEGSVQYAWLVNDLIKATENRTLAPFIIVVTHRPLQHLPNSTLFKTVYPLFVQYQVQLIITGHMHVYERIFYDNTTTIINNTYANVHSPVIVVQGTGGAFDNDKWIEPQPWWSKSRMIAYGYGRVTVSANITDRRLHYEYLLEHERNIYDEFSIVI